MINADLDQLISILQKVLKTIQSENRMHNKNIFNH